MLIEKKNYILNMSWAYDIIEKLIHVWDMTSLFLTTKKHIPSIISIFFWV